MRSRQSLGGVYEHFHATRYNRGDVGNGVAGAGDVCCEDHGCGECGVRNVELSRQAGSALVHVIGSVAVAHRVPEASPGRVVTVTGQSEGSVAFHLPSHARADRTTHPQHIAALVKKSLMELAAVFVVGPQHGGLRLVSGKQQCLGFEVFLDGVVVIQVVLGQVRESRNRVNDGVGLRLAQRMGGDLHDHIASTSLDELAEETLQVGGLRGGELSGDLAAGDL